VNIKLHTCVIYQHFCGEIIYPRTQAKFPVTYFMAYIITLQNNKVCQKWTRQGLNHVV